jgi:hypothetical protein
MVPSLLQRWRKTGNPSSAIAPWFSRADSTTESLHHGSIFGKKWSMERNLDLRAVLDAWPVDGKDSVRSARGADGREIILVRQPMGVEQYEADGRPDGQRVHGLESAFDFHQARITAARQNDPAGACDLSAEDCTQLVHEAAAYHRRMLLLFRLKDWTRVERDTARNLRLIEFIKSHARHAEDRVQLDPWHSGTTRINTVARVMILLESGHHGDARKIVVTLGIPNAIVDDASGNVHLAEALLASVRDCLVDHVVCRLEEDALFVRQDDYWVIVYHGKRALLKDSRGLHCLALLLRYPGCEFHVGELLAHLFEAPALLVPEIAGGFRKDGGAQLVTVGLSSGHPVLDAQAKAQYKHRLNELREEFDEAGQRNDAHRAAKAQEEMDAIAQHLFSAIGLGGRDRKTSSDAERARCAVTKRIKQAIQKIAETIPALGHHFSARIKTGYFCSYNPHPDRPVAWKF